MTKRLLVGAVCAGMFLSGSTWSPTWAASLQPGQGDLSINQGQGFQPVNGKIDANVGDSVMVPPGGSATVVYDDGCTVNVEPGAVTTIAPLSPCASGSNAADLDYAAWLLAGGAGGLAGYAIYLATQSGSSSTPASP